MVADFATTPSAAYVKNWKALGRLPNATGKQKTGAPIQPSDHTVSGVREELEGIGQIVQSDRKTKDGRTYPAKRSSVFATDKAQAQRAFDALAKTPDIDCPCYHHFARFTDRTATFKSSAACG